MLALDDPLWTHLEHAYGAAADIPNHLRKLAVSTGPSLNWQTEPWHSLWSSLCHQEDVYTASYAAVPHIVEIGSMAKGPIDFGFFQLPAAIEVARRRKRGPNIPPELSRSYHDAVARLVECVSLHRHEPWDQAMLLSAAAAQAVAKGHIDAAEALLKLDGDWIEKINRGEFD